MSKRPEKRLRLPKPKVDEDKRGAPVFTLLEEALHLLRAAPPGTHAIYLAATAPFVLGLLFFWAEMSRSGLAAAYLVPASALLALLYALMKVGHAAYARSLYKVVRGKPPEPLQPHQWLQLASRQATRQPPKLLLQPLSMLIGFPLPWCFAYYQGLTAAEALGGNVHQRALAQAQRWPRQSVFLAFIVWPSLVKLMFINWLLLMLFVPTLLDMMFGIETEFVRTPWAFFNSTFFAVVAALTYLCCDPVMKAVFLLRTFYSEAQTTGEDILTELEHLPQPRKKTSRLGLTALLLLIAVLSLAPATSEAAATSAPEALGQGTAEHWDDAFDETLRQRKYVWRYPREDYLNQEPPGWFTFLQDSIEAIFDWVGDIWDWFRDLLTPDNPKNRSERGEGIDWDIESILRVMAYVLLGILAVVILVFIIRALKRIPQKPVVTIPEVKAKPDLESDELTAEDAPLNEWMALARQQLAAGNYRLALRALFLAQLSQMAERRLIRLARHKTNRDYRCELQRRNLPHPSTLEHFRQDTHCFEAVWYGQAVATAEDCRQLENHLQLLA